MLASLLVTTSEKLAAQDAIFSITLSAPDDAACPDAQALEREVETRVGIQAALPMPEPAEPPALAITVVIEPTEAGHRALVSVADRAGTALGSRELLAQGSCAALQEMLVLVISTSVGVARPAPPSPARNEPVPQPAAVPEPLQPPAAALDIVHARGPARPWTLDVVGSLRLETGIALRPIVGPSLSLWITLGVLRLGVSGTWLAPASDTAAPGLSLRLTGAYGELNLCGIVAQSDRAGVAMCLAPRAGALHAKPFGLARAAPHWGALVQLSASMHAHWLLAPPLGLTFALGAALPVFYPRYVHVDERGETRADHTPELGVWFGLGVFLRLRP